MMKKKLLNKIMIFGMILSMGVSPVTTLAAEESGTEMESTYDFINRDYSDYIDDTFSDIHYEIADYEERFEDRFSFTANKVVSVQEVYDKFNEVIGEDIQYKRKFTLEEKINFILGFPLLSLLYQNYNNIDEDENTTYTIIHNDENGIFHEYSKCNYEVASHLSFIEYNPSYYIDSIALFNESDFDKARFLNADGTLNPVIFNTDDYKNNIIVKHNVINNSYFFVKDNDFPLEKYNNWFVIYNYKKSPFEVKVDNNHTTVSFFPMFMCKPSFSSDTWKEVDTISMNTSDSDYFIYALKSEDGYCLDKNSISTTVTYEGKEYQLISYPFDDDFVFNFPYVSGIGEDGENIVDYKSVNVKFKDYTLIKVVIPFDLEVGEDSGVYFIDGFFETLDPTNNFITIKANSVKEKGFDTVIPDFGSDNENPSPDKLDYEYINPNSTGLVMRDDIDTSKMTVFIPITIGVVGCGTASFYVFFLADRKKKKVHGIWSVDKIPGTKVKGHFNDIKTCYIPEIVKTAETKTEAITSILGCEVYTLFPEDTKFSIITTEGNITVEEEEALYRKLSEIDGFVTISIDSAGKNIHLTVDFEN